MHSVSSVNYLRYANLNRDGASATRTDTTRPGLTMNYVPLEPHNVLPPRTIAMETLHLFEAATALLPESLPSFFLHREDSRYYCA